jgi:hypothetical protein
MTSQTPYPAEQLSSDDKSESESSLNLVSCQSLDSLDEGTYHDYFHQDVNSIKREIQLPKGKRRGPRGGVVVPFPVKLYAMLEGTQKENLEHIVSWQAHGRCFTVHKPNEFVNDIMPR